MRQCFACEPSAWELAHRRPTCRAVCQTSRCCGRQSNGSTRVTAAIDAQITEVEVGYGTGADRLLLWLPVVVTHRITEDSPLASWANMSGFLADADSCIALTARRQPNPHPRPAQIPRVRICIGPGILPEARG